LAILAVPLRPGARGTGGMFRAMWCRLRALLVVSASAAATPGQTRRPGPASRFTLGGRDLISGAARRVWPVTAPSWRKTSLAASCPI